MEPIPLKNDSLSDDFEPVEQDALGEEQPALGGEPGANELREYAVSDNELADKQGNFVFTVGNVGCGKSTLQNLLIARLWGLQDVHLEYTSKKNDPRHDKLLNDWVVSIKHGHLPERTKQGHLQEFNIAISQPKRQKLALNFLEISGEDIKSIVPTLDVVHRPKINHQLVEYLRAKKSKLNKRFIFVSDCEENKRISTSLEKPEFTEDILFNALLRHLLGKEHLAMERISVLFVAAKWDAVESEYRSIEHYFRRNFTQTRAVLQSGRCQTTHIPFSVGRIEDVEVEDEHQGERYYVKRITSLENKYVDILIQWIYFTFTGNYLKGLPKLHKSLFDRAKDLFR